MPTVREVAIQGSCDRDDTGSGVQRQVAMAPCCIARVSTRSVGNSWKVLSWFWRRAGDGATKRSLLLTALFQHGLAQLFLLGMAQEVGQDVGDLLRPGVCQFAHLVTC